MPVRPLARDRTPALAAVMLAGLLLPASAHADAPARCHGETTPEVEACLTQELAGKDAELQLYLGAALKRLAAQHAADVRSGLLASQSAWLTYRSKACEAVWEQWKAGTIRNTMALICERRLTEARTYEIWFNWLTYRDSTKPVLPEPALERGR